MVCPCIAVAAISHPKLIAGRLPNWVKEIYRQKMRVILQVAARKQHKFLILSALGCGAFKNPPEDIAELFEEVIFDEEFQSEECCIEKIWFAVVEDHNSRGNVAAFRTRFGVASQ